MDYINPNIESFCIVTAALIFIIVNLLQYYLMLWMTEKLICLIHNQWDLVLKEFANTTRDSWVFLQPYAPT